MVSTRRISISELSTWHETGPFPVDLVYKARQSGSKDLDLHNESVEEVQNIIRECVKDGKRFRAIGSLWSLNNIAFNDSRLHDNSEMDIRLRINEGDVHPNSKIPAENLVFAQCGTTVNQLTTYLEEVDKSLKVCGGSNGQTIVGAISTGVHGGAFESQCMSDFIKGFHLIIGSEDNDRIYLERSSEPVLEDGFSAKLKSRIVRDDDIFNAVLVGLGSFGFIAAVVIEVENLFSLKRYVRKIDYDDAMQLMKELDFSKSKFKIPEECDSNGNPLKPFHFKTFVNQYTKKSVAEAMYKVPYQKTAFPPYDIAKQLHPDLFSLMQWALEKSNGKVVNFITRLLQNTAFPTPNDNEEPLIGTLGDMFHSVSFVKAGFSWALGVDNQNLPLAMKTFTKVCAKYNAPGLCAVKLVKQTNSTIGFTKFPTTAVIHMDGIQWVPQPKLPPQKFIEEEIINAFLSKQIEFTLHWGKNACWNYPNLLNIMYGTKDDKWVKQRSRLLSYEMADMFSNPFIRNLGLGGYNRGVEIVT